MKIITCASYIATGSSAVTDFFTSASKYKDFFAVKQWQEIKK